MKAKVAKVVILTDLHFSKRPNEFLAERRNELADVLLLRAVHRINRYIKPDLVFIGGDLINEPDCVDRLELLAELKKIIDLIEVPVITIPGNHDPKAAEFYSVMEAPPEVMDVNGVRFVPFDDPEAPGFNALRPAKSIACMRKLGADFSGPVVSLQHVPLFPPEETCCGYNYTNAEEVIQVMRDTNYVLALSGHYHHGFELFDRQGLNFIAGRGLCEEPFGYAVLEIDTNGKVACIREDLAMPKELKLVDHHVHTPLAYCNENMDIAKSIIQGKAFGLDGMVISEHSAHLYFNRADYGQRKCYIEGMEFSGKLDRTNQYFELYERESTDFCRLGMEIDIDYNGKKLVETQVLDKIEFRNGAVHSMASLIDKSGIKAVEKEFLFLTESALALGVDVLVHPFRVFNRSGLETPVHLFAPVVKLLKKYGAAAEINYHTNNPDPEFFRMCIDKGVKISFGSDAHNLYEVGEFYANLKFMREIAPDFDINELLIR
jgi:histidinol phosphatase-like PHP family hydrolase/Icc-related predicted phosphoesterase